MEPLKILITGVIIFLLIPISASGQHKDTLSVQKETTDPSGSNCPDGAYARYKINKSNYSYKKYSYEKGDPYHPFETAVSSLLIPGMGQISIKEYKRGYSFLGIAAGSLSHFPIGFNIALKNYDLGRIVALSGLSGYLVTAIWSSVDASRVVKVNNLAWRDMKHSVTNISLEPVLAPLPLQLQNEFLAGLCLKVRF